MQWLTQAQLIDGKRWIVSADRLPADCMIIMETPSWAAHQGRTAFLGQSENDMLQCAVDAGIDLSTVYRTYAVKYVPKRRKPPKAGDWRTCRPYLWEEIRRCRPRTIIAAGTSSVKMLFDNRYKISDARGCILSHPDIPGCNIVPMYSYGHLDRNSHLEWMYRHDWNLAGKISRGEQAVKRDANISVINDIASLRELVNTLVAEPRILSLDCEWHGRTWMDPARYLRTVQIGVDVDTAVIVELFAEGEAGADGWVPENRQQMFDDIPAAMIELKRLLEHPNVMLVGHNTISDGEWLLSFGIDIRDRVKYDTMLAEYLLSELGPFGLDALACRYTEYGRYDAEVMQWKLDHPRETEYGFGAIPRRLLLPYGGLDVTTPLRAMRIQMPQLEHALKPRGRYPSLFQTMMDTQRNIYEMEVTGMRVDVPRLKQIATAYIEKLAHMETVLKGFTQTCAMSDFNHRSVDDVRTLLYDVLKLTPIKTTDDREWRTYIATLSPEEQQEVKASTDKTSLQILQAQHPVVKQLLNIRRVDTIVKNSLQEDDEATEISRGGGLMAKIWPDGRFHTRFSQLSDTGRFKHRKPNSANFSKKAEGYLKEIFGDAMPPALRTVVIPTDGHVIMEADFKQAELFVLAGLSGDSNMMAALTTPGRDLHDKTAMDAFGFRIYNENGVELTSDDLVVIARQLNNTAYFDAFLATLTYVDGKGKRYTRKAFKNGPRVGAKNLNFGIPYGRGAAACALQVLAETGTDTPLAQLTDELKQMVNAWKTTIYPRAWDYMQWCAEAVISPGYLVNPWNQMRRFGRYANDEHLASLQREAQNWPIQSTVAGTTMLAMQLMVNYRSEHNLHFKLINQVHDAIMIEAPIDEIEASKTMFKATMGNIEIPMSSPLRLEIDIEVMSRWSEEIKE